MAEWLSDVIYPINRWLHLVCTTLILGGTLFFELVLPAAIEDLKREQQLYVFARARWVFRWVVWIGVAGLLLSGAASLARQWDAYHSQELMFVWRWAVAHMLLGLGAIVIALLLTVGNRPPENPVLWMRLNVVILITVIFLASATRHFQLDLLERRGKNRPPVLPDGTPLIEDVQDVTVEEQGNPSSGVSASQPTTRPAGG